DVLSSQRGNLYALVPEGKALEASFSLDSLPGASVGSAMAAYPQSANGQLLIKAIQQILADYVNNGVPSDLVEAAKLHELANEEFQKNSISGLAMKWSNALGVEGRQSPKDDIRAIEKVTVGEVNHVAR